MLKNRAVLPRLDYLLAFEVAAELESFAAAAKELNVSETSVSRKIRLLELHFGCALFQRGHRSVQLTDQGRRLLNGVRGPLKALADLSADLRVRKSRRSVRVSATNSVASLWLMPRMPQFHDANYGITISLFSSDIDSDCLDEDFDLSILRGDGDWPGYEATQLFGETIFPVCSPKYLENHLRIDGVTELLDHALIEVNSEHTEWMTWRTWFGKQGADPERMRHSTFVNTYPLAIQAAIDGLGIALGWGHLVDRHLENGSLVRPIGGEQVRTSSGYYMLRAQGAAANPESDVVARWLLQESAARKRYGTTADAA